MAKPLVTVICVSYNHKEYVREAIESVVNQTYQPVQLIVVDDASPDGSAEEIKKLGEKYSFEQVLLAENIGYCSAFNRGFKLAKGEFIIDLAADDVLLPSRIQEGVEAFSTAGAAYGVNFSDAEFIDASGKQIGNHSDRFAHDTIPQGDIYKELIEKYFICSPTMMIRKTVLDRMGGFDEELEYEDFDLWIRASRYYKFCYTPKVLVKKRKLTGSMGQNQFQRSSEQLKSTFKVCEKIYRLNFNREEKRALTKRLWYELGVNLRLFNFLIVLKYIRLLIKNVVYG